MKRLAGVDLIPVLSYIKLKGRCRRCDTKIPPRYPIVEIACALLFFGFSRYSGVSLSILPLCMLAFVLLCVSFIDWDTQEIPDGLLIYGAAFGVLWVAAANILPALKVFDRGIFGPPFIIAGFANAPSWQDALLGILAGGLPLFLLDRLTLLVLKKDGFGYGDVKLMAMVGLFLGWKMTLVAYLIAVVAGGAYGAFLMLTRRAGKGSYLAFGPFLSAGALLTFWIGKPLLRLLFGVDI